jgi:hypothetical protein
VLLTAALGRGVASSVRSFRRFYARPGVAFVAVPDAPVEHTVLATRAGDPRPAVAAFRSVAVTLADMLTGVDARLVPVHDS